MAKRVRNDDDDEDYVQIRGDQPQADPAHERWLRLNKEKFASPDGLPAEFHRGVIFSQIRPQSRVAIQNPQGQIRVGHVVMRGPAGWVLNMGGRHGTPGIADETNTVWCTGAKL